MDKAILQGFSVLAVLIVVGILATVVMISTTNSAIKNGAMANGNGNGNDIADVNATEPATS